MVTKHTKTVCASWFSSVLAKILMVTKPTELAISKASSSVLAKILMVTKLCQCHAATR